MSDFGSVRSENTFENFMQQNTKLAIECIINHISWEKDHEYFLSYSLDISYPMVIMTQYTNFQHI